MYVNFSGTCSIELRDMVILTGGYWLGDGQTDASSIVSIYDQNGWRKDLPSLQQERKNHGCGSYNDDENNIVSKQNL